MYPDVPAGAQMYPDVPAGAQMFPDVPADALPPQQPSFDDSGMGVENAGDAILGSSTMLITVFILVLTMCLTVFLAIVFTTESGAEVTEGTIISMSLPPLNFPENKPPRVAQDDAHDVPGDAHDVTHVDTNGNDGGNDDASLYAGLTCVTSERAAADTVDYVQLYQPCDNVIYRIGSACQNAGPKPGLKAIAALGDDKTKYVGFDYDGSQDITCYADLGRIDGWQNNGYAVLSVVLADDFSDVADVSGKVKIAFDAIKGTSDMDKPKIVGIEINPVDADVTKENAKKLRDLLNGVSLVIFQTHLQRHIVPCTISISDVLISKKNVITLMEDVSVPVAISTTAALALITTDGQHTERGSRCAGMNLVKRSTICALMKGADQDGHSVPPSFSNTVVIEYISTASASSLLPDMSVKHRAKYGVAVFNLEYYFLDQFPKCPPLNLSAFKLPRPDQQ